MLTESRRAARDGGEAGRCLRPLVPSWVTWAAVGAVYTGVGCSGEAIDGGVSVQGFSVISRDTVIATEGGLLGVPTGISRDALGRLWIADGVRHRLLRVDPGGEVEVVGREGEGPGEFVRPEGVSVSGSEVFVMDFGNRRIQTFSLDGEALDTRALPLIPYLPLALSRGALAMPTLGGPTGSLAAVVRASGEVVHFGKALVTLPPSFSVSAIRAQVGQGEVPVEFQNNVLPVPRSDGGLWVVHQSTGRLDSYDSEGRLLWDTQLPDRWLRGALASFFQAWEDRPIDIHVPWSARGGTEADGHLWLAVDRPGAAGSDLLLIRGDDGKVIGHAPIPVASPVSCLDVDPLDASVVAHLCLPEEASILRVVLGGMGVGAPGLKGEN